MRASKNKLKMLLSAVCVGIVAVSSMIPAAAAPVFTAEEGVITNDEPLDNSTIILEEYKIDGADAITPGEEFKLDITLRNTSYTGGTGNIYATFSQDEKLIYPAYGESNECYVGYLKKDDEEEGSFSLMASDDITDSYVLCNITVTYSDAYRTYNTNSFQIQLPVSSTGILAVHGFDMDSNAEVGSNNRVGVTVTNSGRTALNNVVLHMEGDSIDAQQQSLGSLTGNTTTNTDCYVAFKKVGQQNVNFYFTYTDVDGAAHETRPQTYSFNVGVREETQPVTGNSRRKVMNLVMTCTALAGSIVFLGILFGIIKMRKGGMK
ncbi:hypothetical protein SAMN06296386_103115 [Lachnospiraceae bacterium]|nr:hypothetical protein SAMN06296386_103115 [Lachnospiraceae bacterium]